MTEVGAVSAVFLLLLVAFDATALRVVPGLGEAIPMRSEEGRRLQPTALLEVANSLGVTLHAVHTERFEDDALVHVRHPVEPAPTGPGPLFNVSSERELVRLLLHMSMAAYRIDPPKDKEVIQPIIDNRDSLYGTDVSTYEQEVVLEEAHMKKWFDFFKSTFKAQNGGTGIDASSLDTTGVHALEFTVSGIGKVVAFRGTKSKGDYDNMKLWMADWIVTKMSAKLKHAWRVGAGLPWSTDLKKQKTMWPKSVLHSLVRLGCLTGVQGLTKRLKALAKGTNGLVDAEKVAETGYWEFTKRIALVARDNLADGEKLIFTGHSAGGTRGMLSSMLLEKRFGEKHRAVTFAAVGGQCFTRSFSFSGATLGDDVDIYKRHDQMTDYAHPLDVYASVDYGYGKRCVYGLSGIERSKAQKYCGDVFGHRGSEIMLGGKIPGLKEILGKFMRCRYFTHAVRAMDSDLANDDYLREDGTTDGGCFAVELIPKDDPDMKCPSPGGSEGCMDELSCESCQVSSSGPCYWLESSGTCASRRPKKAGAKYIGPEDTCPGAQPGRLHLRSRL